MSMIICQNCGHDNRIGTFFCEDCGRSLAGLPLTATVPTRSIPNDLDDASAKATWGPASVPKGSALLLRFGDTQEPLTVRLSQRLIFGRADKGSTLQPDIDLSPFSALEKGVSRHHAVIEYNEDTLMIQDMGSSNGTFLNGQRLLPNQPRVLRDGDEIRMGKLVAHVYFK